VANTSVILRILLGILGLILVACGVMYAVLGLWGMSRGGNGAWILAILGLAGAFLGGGFVRAALRQGGESPRPQ